MSVRTKTTVRGDGYEIDVEIRCRADPGKETAALRQAGRLRGTIKQAANQ